MQCVRRFFTIYKTYKNVPSFIQCQSSRIIEGRVQQMSEKQSTVALNTPVKREKVCHE